MATLSGAYLLHNLRYACNAITRHKIRDFSFWWRPVRESLPPNSRNQMLGSVTWEDGCRSGYTSNTDAGHTQSQGTVTSKFCFRNKERWHCTYYITTCNRAERGPGPTQHSKETERTEIPLQTSPGGRALLHGTYIVLWLPTSPPVQRTLRLGSRGPHP